MIITNQELVNFLADKGELSLSVRQALLKIDRRFFVPPRLHSEAYEDYPLPIGAGQTISQPSTVVFMLEQLQVESGQRVLEIGCGCGWASALISWMVGTAGIVVGMDIIPELVNLARRNIQNVIASSLMVEKSSLLEIPRRGVIPSGMMFTNLKFVIGDGGEGFRPEAPYDRIIVSAGAKKIPPALLEQLKDNGRLVIPVGDITQDIVVIEKHGKKLNEQRFSGFVFVPLV